MVIKKEKQKFLLYYLLITLVFISTFIRTIFYPHYISQVQSTINSKKLENDKFVKDKIFQINEEIDTSKKVLSLISELRLVDEYTRGYASEEEMKALLLSVAKNFCIYSKISLLDRNGYEKIKIINDGASVKFSREDQLSNLSNSYFYKEIKALAPKILWLSNMDPTKEKGNLVTPLLPNLRLAVKLTNQEILIFNMSLVKKFDLIMNSAQLGNKAQFFLNTNSGTWIISKKNLQYFYTPETKGSNFFAAGYIKEEFDLKEIKKDILFHMIYENLWRIAFINTVLILLGYFLYNFICKKVVLTYTDSLTGCYNRNFFENKVKDIKNLNRYSLCYIDIDNLKFLNDNFGHRYGDNLILGVTRSLKSNLEKDSVVIRLGGDEFLILSKKPLEELEKNIIFIKERTSNIKICDIPISFSYGIESGEDFFISLEKAESKMYKMKQAGHLNISSMKKS